MAVAGGPDSRRWIGEKTTGQGQDRSALPDLLWHHGIALPMSPVPQSNSIRDCPLDHPCYRHDLTSRQRVGTTPPPPPFALASSHGRAGKRTFAVSAVVLSPGLVQGRPRRKRRNPRQHLHRGSSLHESIHPRRSHRPIHANQPWLHRPWSSSQSSCRGWTRAALTPRPSEGNTEHLAA